VNTKKTIDDPENDVVRNFFIILGIISFCLILGIVVGFGVAKIAEVLSPTGL